MLAPTKGVPHRSSGPSLLYYEFPSDDLFQLLQAASRFEAGVAIPASGLEPPAATRIAYKQLPAGSEEKASRIRQLRGLAKDSVILLHFDSHAENIEWLCVVIRSGFLPAISTPFSPDAIQQQRPSPMTGGFPLETRLTSILPAISICRGEQRRSSLEIGVKIFPLNVETLSRRRKHLALCHPILQLSLIVSLGTKQSAIASYMATFQARMLGNVKKRTIISVSKVHRCSRWREAGMDHTSSSSTTE